MPRYRVLGIPISPPFSALEGAKVGDTINVRLDKATEELLIGAGALVPLTTEPKPQAQPEAEPDADEEHGVEPKVKAILDPAGDKGQRS